ncbi:MAG: hypothetical protein KAU21_00725, partial [Gammaproteobacteria bacterium]|nr:hypothetical protein [Gammaproteobacteria bacterium]
MNIGVISYSISAFTFLIFLAILLTDRHKGDTKRALLVAPSFNCLWSFTLSYESLLSLDSIQISLIEYFKSISWLYLLVQLLSVAYSDRFKNTTIKKIQYGFVIILLVLILPKVSEYFIKDFTFFTELEYLTALSLFMTIIGIALLEQVYRNTRTEQKWAIKYLCLGLLGMYIYDFYMYADALLYQRIDPVLWQARGFVYALSVPLLGVSISRDPLWSPEIFISRRVVFHTTTLLASGIYLMIMGIAGYYVRDYGGSWGLVAQAIFLFVTVLVLVLFVSSRRIRARIYV